MHFVLCKEQQHSNKQDFFRYYGVAEVFFNFLIFFKLAALIVYIIILLIKINLKNIEKKDVLNKKIRMLNDVTLHLFVSLAHLKFASIFLHFRGYSVVSKLSPDVLSEGGRCFFLLRSAF
jgi:hypothetical protein